MAEEGPSSSFPQDAVRWTETVVDYVMTTQANCLDLRSVPCSSSEYLKVDIQPILDHLIDSNITELHLEYADLRGEIHYLCKILVGSKIRKLCVDATVDDILSLMAILKDTQIAELDLFGRSGMLMVNQVEEFFNHLADSQLRSVKLYGPVVFRFEKVSVVSQRLPSTQITCLDLGNFLPRRILSFGYDPEDYLKLTCLMSSLPHTALTDLNLEWNSLGDSGAEALAVFLGTSKLEKLNLAGNGISDSGVDFLVPGLVSSKISYLNLSYNDIIGDNTLGHSLRDTKITNLDLSENPIHGRILSAPAFLQESNLTILKLAKPRGHGLNILPIGELRFSKLTCLDLSTNSLNEGDVSSLAEVLSHTNIIHINLACNEFSEASFAILGECLRGSVLKYIDLSATVRSDESFFGLASFLDKSKGSTLVGVGLRCLHRHINLDIIGSALANTTLLELDFACRRRGTHLVGFAQQLKFTAITALYLQDSSIGDNSVLVLAKYLTETHIIVLNLSSNPMTSVGAKALARVLKETKIRFLDLRANEIEDDGLVALAENAENSCITYLSVLGNPGLRKSLVDCVLWGNRKKIEHFADLLKQVAFFTGDSNIFEFDRNFDDINLDVFIEHCLKIYKMVLKEPFIINSIEQDKCILDLEKPKCCKFLRHMETDPQDCIYHIFIPNCKLLYETILKQASPVQVTTEESKDVSAFKKQILWLVLEYFPVKFVYFIGRAVEADLEQHVSFLKKVEELGLSRIVELLLLNRPMYLIDKKENILHPYVYQLLSKYKQTICNLEIEPGGLENIIKYFQKHIHLEGGAEVISLCRSISKSL